tara:strand:+ start:210 stop:1010 length:801 start_codon:yes stop_codon:yes gene_type:complete
MLENLFTLDNLTTFLILTALETVLGFDNLLYITLEAKKVDPANERVLRRWGIILAIVLRIVLLFVVLQLIEAFQDPILTIDWSFFTASISGHALIVLVGGLFLIYTAMKEIYHMIGISDLEHSGGRAVRKSFAAALFWIVIMNVVFSFDTVLSAVALTDNFIVMTAAIVISGILMVVMSDTVANFLSKNRMYEVLGLFVLLIVGIVLIAEGGHIAKLFFFSYPIEPMSKATFYFVLFALVAVEVVQTRYQKKLLSERDRAQGINNV